MNTSDEEDLRSRLDPGIADLVMHLRKLGWSTMDSGDGVSKAAHPEDWPDGTWSPWPHVIVDPKASFTGRTSTSDMIQALAHACARFTGRPWVVEAGSYVCVNPDGSTMDVPGRSHQLLLFASVQELFEAAQE